VERVRALAGGVARTRAQRAGVAVYGARRAARRASRHAERVRGGSRELGREQGPTCAGRERPVAGRACARARGRGEGGRREREKEKEKEKEEEREIELAENPAANATGGRAWATGSRAMRDGTAARKKREGTVSGKDGTMIEIGHQDGGNSGRGLGLTGLNDEKVLKKSFLARDLIWYFFGMLQTYPTLVESRPRDSAKLLKRLGNSARSTSSLSQVASASECLLH